MSIRSNQGVQTHIFVILCLGACGLLAAWCGYLMIGDSRFLLIGASLVPTLIVLIPQLFQRRFDLLAPLNFLALGLLFGVTLRTWYVSTVAGPEVRDLLLAGRSPEFLLPAIVLIIVAAACLVVGYLIPTVRLTLRSVSLFRCDAWSYGRLFFLVLALVAVGLTSLVVYVRELGIVFEGLASFSAKRRLDLGVGEYQYAVMGYHLWGMSLLSYAFYLAWVWFVTERKRFCSVSGLALAGLALLAAIPPILVSSRTDLALLILAAAMIWNYGRRRLTIGSISRMALLLLLVFTVMTQIRAMGSRSGAQSLDANLEAVPAAVLGNRNWIGVTKTAHILDAVPSRFGYQYGRTMVSWVYAPIPRSLWLDKPVIRVGLILGRTVFEWRGEKSGVPPGFIGELYLNFGYLGVIVGMLGLGMVLRVLYGGFGPLLEDNKSALLIYIVLVVAFSFTLPSTDVSGAVIEIIRSMLTVGLLILVVRRGSINVFRSPRRERVPHCRRVE